MRKVRIGNIRVFCKTIDELEELIKTVGRNHVAS